MLIKHAYYNNKNNNKNTRISIMLKDTCIDLTSILDRTVGDNLSSEHIDYAISETGQITLLDAKSNNSHFKTTNKVLSIINKYNADLSRKERERFTEELLAIL